MKKLVLCTVILVQSILIAQCPSDDIILFGQSQINEFSNLYPDCESITGFLVIEGNDITDVTPLAQLTSVGSVLIKGTSLTSMNGLESLAITGLEGEDTFIVIDDNALLENLLFLNNYTINEPIVFIIRDMSGLNSLDGAGNISEFVALYIENNDSLTDLNGLNDALNIYGGLIQAPLLFISENDALTDISRLDTADAVDGISGTITNNSQLAVCENEFVCRIINDGTANILDNASGCNSTTEVEMACDNLSTNDYKYAQIELYPNPVTDKFFVRGTRVKKLEVFSLDGKKVSQKDANSFDLSFVESGVYFIKITTDRGSVTKRIIKE